MTSKREWKRRALVAELEQHRMFEDAVDAARERDEWKQRAEGANEVKFLAYDAINEAIRQRNTNADERDQAIAERDRARDTAAALEGEVARLTDGIAALRDMPGRRGLIGDVDFDALVGDDRCAVVLRWDGHEARCTLDSGHDGATHLVNFPEPRKPWPNVGGAT